LKDTICALSTVPGRGAIAVIRVSGPDVPFIYRKLTRLDNLPEPRYSHLVTLFDKDGNVIDRALCVYFKAPYSYTGEDMLEFYTHGGFIIPDILLRTLYFYGARQAEPGEFTKRAFLSGKMDLIQAEAVNDIINARTEEQFKKALSNLKGNLTGELEPVLELIKRILMEIEARIEFEEDVGPLDRDKVNRYFAEIREELVSIKKRAQSGRYIIEGVKVVIVGKVNAGKSTLFNSILGKERSIVTPYAGTTRDIVHEEVEIHGIPVRFIDTAGIRDSADPVERMGIERTKEALKDADFAILVEDAVSIVKGEIWKFKPEIPFIKVASKIDLVPASQRIKIPEEYLMVSAKYGEGMDDFIKKLEESIKEHFYRSDAVILKSRELAIIEGVMDEIEKARALFESNIEEMELVSYHLNQAYRKQMEIFGYMDMPEEVLNSIFKDFCIGK